MKLSPLAAEIGRRLLRMMCDDELVPGAHLRETALAVRFQVSRSPLREALHALARHGIVRHEPHRGCFVAEAARRRIERARRNLGNDDADASYREIAAQRLEGKLPER